MSHAGTQGGAAASAPQRYFCHQCNRTVTLTISPTDELSCPICHGGFLEEFDLPTPTPNPNPFFSFSTSTSSSDSFFPSPFLFSSSSSPASFDIRNPSDLSGLFDPSAFRSPSSSGPEPFNPLLFLQNYFQTLTAGGANIQVVLEGGGGSSDFRIPANLGDYFIGPGLEQLIQQLAENDPNRYGTPPASKSSIDSLPDIKISEDLLASDEAECAVCKDTFEIGAEAKQMPCKHIYHKDCILTWLGMHNSCPVCRHELPTDDQDYEQRRSGEPAPAEHVVEIGDSGGGGRPATAAGEVNSPGERRFRISLPWPFRAFGSPAEASNSGAGGNSGGSGGGGDANSGGRGHQGETRREDLD